MSTFYVCKIITEMEDDDDSVSHFGPFDTKDESAKFGQEYFHAQGSDAEFVSWESVIVTRPAL